jgi:hypothetical protein
MYVQTVLYRSARTEYSYVMCCAVMAPPESSHQKQPPFCRAGPRPCLSDGASARPESSQTQGIPRGDPRAREMDLRLPPTAALPQRYDAAEVSIRHSSCDRHALPMRLLGILRKKGLSDVMWSEVK